MLSNKALHFVKDDGTLGRKVIGVGKIQWNNKSDDYGGIAFDFFPTVHSYTSERMRLGIQVALKINETEETNSRVWLSDSKQTIITPAGVPIVQQMQGVSLRWLLSRVPLKIPVEGEAVLDITLTGNPGELLAGPINAAQAAGWLPWLTKDDWTGVHDSLEAPWPVESIRTVTFRPNATIGNLVDWLQYDRNLIDVRFRERMFRIFNWRTSTDDYATPAPGKPRIVLRAGQLIQSGDRTGSARGMATVGFVIGSDGRWAIEEDAAAIAEYEKLAEILQSGELTVQSEIDEAAELLVQKQRRPIGYKGYILQFDDDLYPPAGPYVVGGWTLDDKVLVDDRVNGLQVVRIPEITTTWGEKGGEPEVAIQADTRLVRKLERIERELAAVLVTGSVNDHRVPPAAPTDLVLATSLDPPPAGGQVRAKVTGSVTIPTTKADGDDLLEPLDRVEARWRYQGQHKWKTELVDLATGLFEFEDLKPSRPGFTAVVEVEVDAWDKAGPSAPVADSITTAEGRSFVGYDSAGDVTFEHDGEKSYQRKYWVRGETPGVPEPLRAMFPGLDYVMATGPGIREDETQYEVWGVGGPRLIRHDYTDGSAEYLGSMHIGGALTVDGTTTIGGTTTIDDTLNVTGAFNVTGTSTLGGTLNLDADLNALGFTIAGARLTTGTGNVVIDDDTISLGSSTLGFNVGGAVFSDDVAVGGSLQVSSTFTLTGTATFNGSFDHNGSTFGVFSASPVGVQTPGAAATDLATVITLANNLRTGLRNLGFFA